MKKMILILSIILLLTGCAGSTGDRQIQESSSYSVTKEDMRKFTQKIEEEDGDIIFFEFDEEEQILHLIYPASYDLDQAVKNQDSLIERRKFMSGMEDYAEVTMGNLDLRFPGHNLTFIFSIYSYDGTEIFWEWNNKDGVTINQIYEKE